MVPLRSVFSCQGPTRRWAPGWGGFRNPLGQLQPGLGNDMLRFHVPCHVSLHRFWTRDAWFVQRLELDPHGERALARIRVRSRDVSSAEATQVSWSPSRADVKAHARRRLKCRVRVQGSLRFWWRLPVKGHVRVRVRSQEAPGAEPTAGLWSPRRAELRAQVSLPVRFSRCLSRPHTSMGS